MSLTPEIFSRVSTSSSVNVAAPCVMGPASWPRASTKNLSVPNCLNCSWTASSSPREMETRKKIVAIEMKMPSMVSQALSFLLFSELMARAVKSSILSSKLSFWCFMLLVFLRLIIAAHLLACAARLLASMSGEPPLARELTALEELCSSATPTPVEIGVSLC